MEARMRRDFEALDRSEAAAAMAEAREWERVAAEAVAGREKYRGVKKAPSGKYVAEIWDDGKQQWLGTYSDALVAACAYDLAARRLRGHSAKTNFAYPPPPGLVSAVAATPRRQGHSYPAPLVGLFSFQEPAASETAPFQAYPSPHLPRPTSARLVLGAPAVAPETETTAVRSILPESFSFKTCFSSTLDPRLTDSASSSSRRRPLMLVKPKVIAVPTSEATTTTPTHADCEFTDDNFTEVWVPWFFNLPPSARMHAD